MQYLNNKNKLLDLMAQGATVITPNNRLSGALLRSYFQRSQNTTVDKPVCMPYSSALVQAYQQVQFKTPQLNHPCLINSSQCQHLWRTILKSEALITYSEGLLSAVMQAWEYCHNWLIDSNDPVFHYTLQTRQFQQWWNHASETIQKLGLITEHQLVPYLLKTQSPVFSKTVVWVCFDDFSPQQLSLQNYLSNNNVEQFKFDLSGQKTEPKILAASDTKDEYQQLISWLQLKLQQGERRIGVVIPDLQTQSRSLQRELLSHFSPTEFDISLGQNLSEFPLIAHALAWLNLDQRQIHYHQAALLLQSPYIGFAKEEFLARSQYLQDSALLQEQSIPLNRLIRDATTHTPKLAELLNSIKPYPKIAAPQEWVLVFQQRLNAIGFPGDYGLNSENYQCYNRFTEIFDELRQLSILSPQLSAKAALDAFTQLIGTTIFQAQKTNAPIQISGLLEASGCEFDSLWVMGLTDRCLPQKVRLSAFIPPKVQRDLMMPHSVPSKELHFAQHTLQRLRNGSEATVFSYPRLQGDNPNLPCSLITEFPIFTRLDVPSETLNQSCFIVTDESYNLPLAAKESFSGGTRLLANQAQCPFKAFAEHRLAATPMLHTTDGLDNMEKGQLIHKIMELLWKTLGSHNQLLKLNSAALEQHIEASIQTALTPLGQLHPETFSNLIQEVEFTRLKRLVLSCLEWEKQRIPFEVVALEATYSINLAGLDFKVRVDRLDQVGDKKWVIDYKSTLPSSKPWNEDRPTEPQLLLYALLDEQINALLLLQLKSGAIACSGLSEEQHNISGINTLKKQETWEESRTNWQQQLTLLAQEFKQGHCPPQPVSTSLCQSCDFQNLCRYQTTG